MDLDTFLTWLYVVVDDYCKQLPPDQHPGPDPLLSRSEAITLVIAGQRSRWASDRAFYAMVRRQWRTYFPVMPVYSQYNRQVRRYTTTINQLTLHLAHQLWQPNEIYEVLDATAAPTRHSSRRGYGWLPQVARGWSNRLHWYVGFSVLTCVLPSGVITGYGFGPANANERLLAETFLACRQTPHPRLPSVGQQLGMGYLADKGFWGPIRQAYWHAAFHATVLCPPERKTRWHWPKSLRRWLHGHRQIIETTHTKLVHPFRLDTDRPHSLDGFATRLAAKMALHNVCCYLNRQLGRPTLAFDYLFEW